MFDPTARTWSLIAGLMLVAVPLTGCVTQDAQASTGSVYVKDAVADDAAEVHVTFTKVEVLPAQANEWAPVYEGEKTIELLSLSDSDAKAELANFEIEPGEYDRLRLTIDNATVTYENGTEEELVVYGNVVTVGQNLSYEAGGELDVLLDFDLDRGVNASSGEYVPVIADAQRSDVDTDDDGVPDINDTDDDGDGVEDAEDDDRDGDGQPDAPAQAQSVDKRGLQGLCTAYEASEDGRQQAANGTDNGTEANASANETADEPHAFQWLEEQADAEGLAVAEYCEDKTAPGAPDDIEDVLPENLPEQARQAVGDRHLGPPEDRPGAPDGAGDERGDERRGGENASQERGDQANDSQQQDPPEDRNQTAEDDDQQRDGNESGEERGNQTAGDGDG